MNERLRKYHREKAREYRAADPQKVRQRQMALRAANPQRGMLYNARQRAKKRGVPCTITAADIAIPDVCPVLGTPILVGIGKGKRASRKDSPSLDCIVPRVGYVPGNVRVISHRANMLKSDATLAELKLVTAYVEQQISEAWLWR